MRSFIKYIAHLTCWYENPFVLREMYRAQRKGHGIWLALALEAVVLAVTLFLVALAGRSYLATRPGHTISYAWGGSVGALLILVMSLLHAVFVSAAVGGRAGDWISKEVAQGTLQTLLVTPMTPTEMVLKRAAWPFVNGVLVALMGLPFYVLCATMGSVSIWTLIGLYAIFAWLAAAASGPGTGRGGGLLLRGASVSVGLVFGFVAFLMFMRAAVRGSWGSFNPLGVVFAAARYVGAAQPFFGFHLPPLLPAVLLSPLWLSAAALSWSWRVYEDDRVLTRMGRARSALAMILALLVLGYLWPNLVGSGAGWAANLVGGVGTAVALRGTLLILLAIVVFVTAWEALSARYATLGTDVLWGCLPDPDRGVRQQLYLSAMGALSSVAPALVLYALGSLLAGLNPLRIGPDALGLSIGAALAGIFYAFGLGVTIWASLAGKRGAQSTVSSLLFVLFIALPIVAKLLPVSGEAKGWLTTFSPFGGLLSLTLSAQWAVQAPIWRVIGMQAALGTLFALGGIAIWEYRMTTYARRARAAAVGRPDLARSRARRWFMALWASVVQRVQDRWDNPVFVREVRVGSRGATWPAAAMFVILALVVLLAAAVRSPRTMSLTASALPYMRYIGRLPPLLGALAATAPLVLMVVVAISAIGPASSAAGHLTRERRRGTLAFTLLTPLKARDLISGAAAAALMPTALLIVVASVPCLALTALSLSPEGWLLALTMILWAVALAIAGAGVALGAAGMYQFRHTAESSAGLIAVVIILLIEAFRVGLTLLASRGTALGLALYIPIWVSFGVEVLAGVAGYAIAVDRLRAMQFGDLPTEHEWLPEQ